MSRVRLALPLRRYTGGVGQLELPAATVGECLAELERRFPGLSGELKDEAGELLQSVNLYVNGEDVRYLSRLDTPLGEQDELAVVVAIAGGSRLPMPSGEGRTPDLISDG